MTDPMVIALALLFLTLIYGVPLAYAVGEYFADKPLAWEWAKICIDAACAWVIVGAM